MNSDTGRITSGMPEYPAILKEIRGYPRELFYIGKIELLKMRCAAVVGSRKTTQYGRTAAKNISRALAEKNIVVVSGMAKGIDACAHRGALEVSGSTIAVLGNGVDICYPEENHELKREIEKHGLVLSEYPPGRKPEKYFFPQRNRIISGLSELTVVVQAGSGSGALITAELAAEQGREVFAVPGNIDSRYNLGNNKLIKEGAVPVTCIQDILDAMGVGGINREEAEQLLGKTEMEIFTLLENYGELTIDELCRLMGKTPAYVSSIVTVMEIKGIVFSALGKIFIAKA